MNGLENESERSQKVRSDKTFTTDRLEHLYSTANLYICCVRAPFIHEGSTTNLNAGLDHAERILHLLPKQTPRPDAHACLFNLVGETYGKVQSGQLKPTTAKNRVGNYERWAKNATMMPNQLPTTTISLPHTPQLKPRKDQLPPPDTEYSKRGGVKAIYHDYDDYPAQDDSLVTVTTAPTSPPSTIFSPSLVDNNDAFHIFRLLTDKSLERVDASSQIGWITAWLVCTSYVDQGERFIDDLRGVKAMNKDVDDLQSFLQICREQFLTLESDFIATLKSSVRLFLQGSYPFDNATVWFAATATFLGDRSAVFDLGKQCGKLPEGEDEYRIILYCLSKFSQVSNAGHHFRWKV